LGNRTVVKMLCLFVISMYAAKCRWP